MPGKYLDQPFTRVPNASFDECMKEMRPIEFQVYAFIIRQTIGWGKKSDEIALSYFQKFIKSSIPTIRKAIEGLLEKGFVKRAPCRRSYKYSIINPPINYKNVKPNFDNSERNLQGKGKESFNEPCKNLTTQKKEQKKKLNTTNVDRSKFRSKVPDDEVNETITNWNKTFNKIITDDDQELKSLIKQVLCYFTADEVKQAMSNRLHSDFYQGKYKLNLHKPYSFFGWLETIENDFLYRSPSKIMTHAEMVKLITEEGYNEERDFKTRWDLKDQEGNPKRELITSHQTN